MITRATLNEQTAYFNLFLNRTPLEEELLRDLTDEALGNIGAVLCSPQPRTAPQQCFYQKKDTLGTAIKRAAQFFGRAVERFTKKMMNRFVRIAEARCRRRAATPRKGP